MTLRLNFSLSPRVTAIKTGTVPMGSITAKKNMKIANNSFIARLPRLKLSNKNAASTIQYVSISR